MRNDQLTTCNRSQVPQICASALVCYSPSMRTRAIVQSCGACERLRKTFRFPDLKGAQYQLDNAFLESKISRSQDINQHAAL